MKKRSAALVALVVLAAPACRRQAERRRRAAADAGRDGDAGRTRRRADGRVRRHREVAALDHHSAAGRRVPHAHRGEVRRPRAAAARCCSRSTPAAQQAAVAALESHARRARGRLRLRAAAGRAGRRKLLDAGAVSQQEYEQAATALQTAEAQLKAVDEQIRQQRAELAYHRVTAPTAGVVGDIPVRVGDRVTRVDGAHDGRRQRRASRSTSTCRCSRRPASRSGCRCGIVDDAGEVDRDRRRSASSSPSVDDDDADGAGQGAARPAGGTFRTDQFVRARVVWSHGARADDAASSRSRASTASTSSFVAEPGEGGATVARQRPVAARADRSATTTSCSSGLKAGEQLIVVGHPEDRRRRAGAADAAGRAGDAGAAGDARRRVHVQRPLHPPADPRDRLLAADHPGGRDRHPDAADRALSRT